MHEIVYQIKRYVQKQHVNSYQIHGWIGAMNMKAADKYQSVLKHNRWWKSFTAKITTTATVKYINSSSTSIFFWWKIDNDH